jgi:hypothetical protein
MKVVEPKVLRTCVPAKRVSTRVKSAGVTALEASQLLSELKSDGESVFGITRGQCSLIDFCLAAIDKVGVPADVSFFTWVVAEYEMQFFQSLLEDGRISGFRLVCDHACLTHRPGFVESVWERFGPDAVRLSATHAKIGMVRGPRGDILIRGSMNLNQNRKLEQFDASMSFELCEWFETVMAEIWELGAVPAHGVSHQDLIDNIERLECPAI